MRGLRNSESVVSLVLLASLVGHIAIQRHFERRSHQMGQLSLAEQTSPQNAPPNTPSFNPSMELPAIENLKHPRFLSDLQAERRVVPALEVQGHEQDEGAVRDGSPPAAVPVPTERRSGRSITGLARTRF